MKRYLAVERAKSKRKMYGFTLYRIKNNKLELISNDQVFSYGSTRGPESEVLTAICDAGEYPKKYRDDYHYKHWDKIDIKYITPHNQ